MYINHLQCFQNFFQISFLMGAILASKVVQKSKYIKQGYWLRISALTPADELFCLCGEQPSTSTAVIASGIAHL